MKMLLIRHKSRTNRIKINITRKDKHIMNENFNSAVALLSPRLRNILADLSDEIKNTTYEIRLRAGKPLNLMGKYGAVFVFENSTCSGKPSDGCVSVSHEEIKDTFNRICSYSIHTFQRSINSGYIPMKGGNRAGICGTAVCSGETVTNVKDISSINIRISKQVFGCGDEITSLVSRSNHGLIIAGPPNSGKTTVLRDVIRQVASGKLGEFYKVCAIDERREISAVCDGMVTNDLGITCDVLDSYPIAQAIDIAVRTLSPDIIACDEISTQQEVNAITKAVNCGVRFILTLHSGSYSELISKKLLEQLLSTNAFDKVVLLSSGESIGKVKQVYDAGALRNEICLNNIGGNTLFCNGDI